MRDSIQNRPPASQTFIRATVRKKDFHPADIIESLPEDATPAQQDSAVQANLPERMQVRSTRPDTLNLPGWDIPSGDVSFSTLPSFQDEGFLCTLHKIDLLNYKFLMIFNKPVLDFLPWAL